MEILLVGATLTGWKDKEMNRHEKAKVRLSLQGKSA